MIVFTSDHGDYLGDHWMGEKDLFHEQSAKIPLIVIDPSRGADARAAPSAMRWSRRSTWRRPSSIISAATPPDHILEGRSLLPLLHGEQPADWRKVVFSEYDYAMQDVRADAEPADRAAAACSWCSTAAGNTSTPPASGRCSTTSKPTRRNLPIAARTLACADVIARLQVGAVRLGAASEDAHHHAEREDRGVCRPSNCRSRTAC